MPRARLIHNPNAGEGKYSNEELTELLKKKGYTITYANAKKSGWDNWDEDDDMIIVAGGDGTVRKLVKKLVKRQLIDKRFPIAVLPLGTANNIASTFYKDKNPNSVIDQWGKQSMRSIDIGRLRGLEDENFFMEGVGVGVFPKLMKEMKEQEDREENGTKEELRSAQQLFADIVSEYKPRFCHLIIDGKDFSGHYVLIEVMNMQAVGPNLELAPYADPSDGLFEIVLVPAEEQHDLATYARKKALGEESVYRFKTIKGKDIHLQWSTSMIHVDDQLIRAEKNTMIHIQLEPNLLVFFVEDGSIW